MQLVWRVKAEVVKHVNDSWLTTHNSWTIWNTATTRMQTTFLVTQLACPMRHAHDDMHACACTQSSTCTQSSRMYTVVGLSTTPNTRVLRSHCQKYTTPLISFSHPMLRVTYIANSLTQGAYGSNPKKRFFQKRLDQFLRKLATL